MLTITIILINDMKLSSNIYIASEQRKARTKTTLMKFLMSRNIRSLCNTTHTNERYVPITGYRRHNCTRTKNINSLGHYSTKFYMQVIPGLYCIICLKMYLGGKHLHMVTNSVPISAKKREIFLGIFALNFCEVWCH